MKKIFLICSVGAMAFASSCKKDTNLENNDQALKSTRSALTGVSTEQFGSKEYLQKIVADTKKEVLKKESAAPSGRMSVCSAFLQAANTYYDHQLGDGNSSMCNNTGTINISYLITISERISASDLTYSFTMPIYSTTIGSTTYVSGTAVLQNVNGSYCLNDPNLYDPYCYRTKIYSVTFKIPMTEYTLISDHPIITKSTCITTGDEQTISMNSTTTTTNDYFLNFPARVFVQADPQVSIFGVSTECSLMCYPTGTVCPTSGYINYQLQSTISPNPNPIIQKTFGYNGNLSIPASPGTYNYSCVLTYSFGQSQPKTGTFTVH